MIDSKKITKKMKAIEAAWFMATPLLLLYAIQLIFGIVQFSGYGAELYGEGFIYGLASALIPGEWFFSGGYVITTIAAVLAMTLAMLVFTFFLVNWVRWQCLITLIFFMVFSFVPFINIAPWAVFWIIAVIVAQK